MEPIPNPYEELKEKQGTEDQTSALHAELPIGKDAGAVQHTGDALAVTSTSDSQPLS